MEDWIDKVDQIGPEVVMHVYVPAADLKGVVVIDSTALGFMVGGGIRMMPDITTGEICALARAMTYKFSAFDFPMGGAKSGIWADPGIKGPKRQDLMRAFGKAVKPLLASGLTVGPDIGTEAQDLPLIYEGAGLPSRYTGLVLQEKEGEPLENHATGYGVVVAARAACEFAGIQMKGATAAIEGFGKVGGGAARYLAESGAKVVAISTIEGTIYNPEGLDVTRLLSERKRCGDQAIQNYPDAQHLERGELYFLPVDILLPGARPYVINGENASRVKAKVISSIANIPLTNEAEEILFQRGVHVVPDFISNAGGITIAIVDILGGTAEKVFRVLDSLIYTVTRDILAEARRKKINPRALSERRTDEKILKARAAGTKPSLEEALAMARKRFQI